jgi:hypothetical protein
MKEESPARWAAGVTPAPNVKAAPAVGGRGPCILACRHVGQQPAFERRRKDSCGALESPLHSKPGSHFVFAERPVPVLIRFKVENGNSG